MNNFSRQVSFMIRLINQLSEAVFFIVILLNLAF